MTDDPRIIGQPNWGVVEEYLDSGEFVALHIVPMVTLDDETVVSAAHVLTYDCPCNPKFETGKEGTAIWNHQDAEHPGSLQSEPALHRVV